jgi:hypothetical protein
MPYLDSAHNVRVHNSTLIDVQGAMYMNQYAGGDQEASMAQRGNSLHLHTLACSII